MKNRFLLPIIFCAVLVSCESINKSDEMLSLEINATEKNSIDKVKTEENFLEILFQLFLEKNKSNSDVSLNDTIYEIYTDGAMPNLRLLENLYLKRIFQKKSWNKTKIKEDVLPIVNCDTDKMYNKSGIYISRENDLINSIFPNLEFDKFDKQKIEKEFRKVEVVVLNTENHIKLYMKMTNGVLSLVAINTMKPCEG